MVNNAPERDSAVTCVGCDVHNCKFNDTSGQYCTATHIKVQNQNAINKGETFCDTFAPKGSF